MAFLAAIELFVFYILGNYSRTQWGLRWFYYLCTPLVATMVFIAVPHVTIIGFTYLWAMGIMVVGFVVGHIVGDIQISKNLA